MAKRIRFMSSFAFALVLGVAAWSALAASPVPAQSSADESSESGCSDPTPAALIADIRVNGGV